MADTTECVESIERVWPDKPFRNPAIVFSLLRDDVDTTDLESIEDIFHSNPVDVISDPSKYATVLRNAIILCLSPKVNNKIKIKVIKQFFQVAAIRDTVLKNPSLFEMDKEDLNYFNQYASSGSELTGKVLEEVITYLENEE